MSFEEQVSSLYVVSFMSLKIKSKKITRNLEFLNFFSRVLIFANLTQQDISRVFNFANLAKIREIRENLYTRKLVRLRYIYHSLCSKENLNVQIFSVREILKFLLMWTKLKGPSLI